MSRRQSPGSWTGWAMMRKGKTRMATIECTRRLARGSVPSHLRIAEGKGDGFDNVDLDQEDLEKIKSHLRFSGLLMAPPETSRPRRYFPSLKDVMRGPLSDHQPSDAIG